ncbi:TIGR02206 family membrane protein [Bacillus sp. AFS055030]|uniref:YwaF family protein n=1 Tax=Bacillus sp. AFS055030 TaxID=2033507 RepID=UPI000BFB8451|nr:TIGR02206 family membrane protein [Bacillus sp. AFS055030]PGL73124.1 TIGR02206 family membrane protein [Bacillus sp. AFS055030]
MERFFQFHSKLGAFRLFSKDHLLTIGILLILCVLLFVFRKQIQRSWKKRLFRFSVAFLLLASEILYHIWLVYENAWSLKNGLPLELSDLTVILGIIMLLTNSYRMFQFMYFAGLASSIQAIMTPDLGHYSFLHFRYFEFFVSHGGVVLACLVMVVASKFRPTIPSMWVTVLIVNLYAACVFFINKALNSNFMYLMKKPENASILDYLGPWPWYLLSAEIVMIVTFYILYSPFWIKRKIERNR